jgi:hypothetical protein
MIFIQLCQQDAGKLYEGRIAPAAKVIQEKMKWRSGGSTACPGGAGKSLLIIGASSCLFGGQLLASHPSKRLLAIQARGCSSSGQLLSRFTGKRLPAA